MLIILNYYSWLIAYFQRSDYQQLLRNPNPIYDVADEEDENKYIEIADVNVPGPSYEDAISPRNPATNTASNIETDEPTAEDKEDIVNLPGPSYEDAISPRNPATCTASNIETDEPTDIEEDRGYIEVIDPNYLQMKKTNEYQTTDLDSREYEHMYAAIDKTSTLW